MPDTPLAPVNVARPEWACPHCGHNYRSDFDAAAICAQAGPATAAVDGVVVLTTTRGERRGTTRYVLGETEAGPVTRIVDDNQVVVGHQRNVNVDGVVVDAGTLEGAEPGDLVVAFGNERQRRQPNYNLNTSVLGGTYKTALELVHGFDRHAWTRRDDSGPVLLSTSAWLRKSEPCTWLTAPTGDERTLFNMLTGNSLDWICGLDDIAGLLHKQAVSGRRNHQQGHWRSYIGDMHLMAVCRAHDAPNVAWAVRWFAEHHEAVIDWYADTLRAWAAGEPVAIPAPGQLHPADSLPKNPGKRRLAQMDGYGTNYRTALSALCDQLTVVEPRCPVPELGPVTSSCFHPRKEST